MKKYIKTVCYVVYSCMYMYIYNVYMNIYIYMITLSVLHILCMEREREQETSHSSVFPRKRFPASKARLFFVAAWICRLANLRWARCGTDQDISLKTNMQHAKDRSFTMTHSHRISECCIVCLVVIECKINDLLANIVTFATWAHTWFVPYGNTNNQYWLVVELPLWKIWVRQLGWLFHSQLINMEK